MNGAADWPATINSTITASTITSGMIQYILFCIANRQNSAKSFPVYPIFRIAVSSWRGPPLSRARRPPSSSPSCSSNLSFIPSSLILCCSCPCPCSCSCSCSCSCFFCCLGRKFVVTRFQNSKKYIYTYKNHDQTTRKKKTSLFHYNKEIYNIIANYQ